MDNNSMKKALASGLAVAALSVVVSTISIAQQPKTVELSIDNEKLNIETSAKTVSKVLEDIGYEFIEGSKINHTLDSKVEEDMLIDIDTEKNITFTKGGVNLNVNTFASNVEEFLKLENVETDEDDIVSPSNSTKLNDGDHVTVDFYDVEEYSKEETVKFEKELKYDFDKKVGESEVTQKGVNGSKELNFRKIIKNGEVISDEKVSQNVTKKPVNEITVKGSKKVVTETIENKTITRENSKMYKGQTKVITKGNDGKRVLTYKVEGEKSELVSNKVTVKPVNRVVEKGTKKRPAVAKTSSRSTRRSSSKYTLRDLQFQGIIRWGGYKYTYYSQRVLPGGGLRIPGRHVNAGGFVADKDGYIVLASSKPKGTVLPTPFGYMGKVYDRGTYGNHLDVYTR